MIRAYYNALFFLQQVKAEKDQSLIKGLPADSDINVWPAFINMVVVLALVVAFIFFLGWLFRKLAGNASSFGTGGFMKILSTLPLGDRRVLTVVKVGSRYFLMGISQNNINNLAELNEEEVNEVLLKENREEGSFARILKKMTGKEENTSQ